MDFNRALLIAEIGINHNGDMNLAKEMIKAASKSGADAVKFQNYKTEDFIIDKTLTYSYKSQGETITESQYDLFKRCELSSEDLSFLKECCDKENITFFSTPTNKGGIIDLKKLGAEWLKNGSDFLGNLPLIREMAKSKIPTILSTGMATQEEIDEAVDAFRRAGGQDLVLLACTSTYPAPLSSLNLKRINTLSERYACKAGFSDHSSGWEAAVASVCLGACMVEKHFTINQNLPGPDQWFSSTPAEFAELVRRVREVELIMGNGKLQHSDTENVARVEFKLSCVANTKMNVGDIISEHDVIFRRPGNGMPPSRIGELIGSSLIAPIEQGECFNLSHIKKHS